MQIAVYSSDGADAGPLLTVASVAPLKSDLRSSANNVALALVSARSGAFLASLVQNLPCAIQNVAAPTNKATRTHNANNRPGNVSDCSLVLNVSCAMRKLINCEFFPKRQSFRGVLAEVTLRWLALRLSSSAANRRTSEAISIWKSWKPSECGKSSGLQRLVGDFVSEDHVFIYLMINHRVRSIDLR